MKCCSLTAVTCLSGRRLTARSGDGPPAFAAVSVTCSSRSYRRWRQFVSARKGDGRWYSFSPDTLWKEKKKPKTFCFKPPLNLSFYFCAFSFQVEYINKMYDGLKRQKCLLLRRGLLLSLGPEENDWSSFSSCCCVIKLWSHGGAAHVQPQFACFLLGF